MATTFSRALLPSNNTDALFRAWGLWISTHLTTTGWVKTSDTGQIDFTTVTKPTLTNEKRGYEIWRMNDALQGASPVYLRIDYGSGSGSALNPGVFLTLGTGSNGTGTITGKFFDNAASAVATAYSALNSTTQLTESFASGDPGYTAVAALTTAAGSYGVVFSIERARDVNGAEIGTHVVICIGQGLGRITLVYYCPRASYAEKFSQCMYAVSGYTTSSVASQKMPVGLLFPHAGAHLLAYPLRSFVICRTNDQQSAGQFELRWEGITTNYLRLPYTRPISNSYGEDAQSRVCLRW